MPLLSRTPTVDLALSLALLIGCGGGGTEPPVQRATKLALTVQPAAQAQSGVGLTAQPTVQLQDDQGTAVSQAGIPISVAIATGGGSLSGTTTVNTASNGRATFAGLAIRGTIGPRTLTFASPDLTPVSSGTIDVAAGVAAVLAARDGNQQTAAITSAVNIPPSVSVTDADNNRVAGVPVTFQVTMGGGTVTPTTPLNTDANGIATVTSWTLGSTPGPNALTATSAALSGTSVVFTATGSSTLATISGTITVSNSLAAQSKAVSKTTSFRFPALVRSKPLLGNDRFHGPGTRSARSRRGRQPPEYTADELIVRFRPTVIGAPPLGSLALASRSIGAAVAGEIRSHMAAHVSAAAAAVTGVSPTIMAARIKVQDAANMSKVAAVLRADPAIATVERNGIVRLESGAGLLRAPIKSSNDPLYPFQAWHYGLMDLPEAWNLTTGSSNVLVAVIDNGIRFDHPGIAANLTSDGYDFVSNVGSIPLCAGGTVEQSGDGDGYDDNPTDPGDYDFNPAGTCLVGLQSSGNHGLHVAGTIGAVGNDGVGVTGVNWTVRIRPVRVIGVGGGTTYDLVQGILYAAGLPADDGAGGTVKPGTAAKVINLSLGGPEDDPVLHDAVIAASATGALIVAAAGNDGTSDPHYPAAYPEVVSVSAVGPDRRLASYSTFGPTVDIAGPGGDIEDGGPTFGIMSTAWDFTTGQPKYDGSVWQGTSMAAPHVAGVAALILAQSPGLTASELRARLTDYAVDAGSPGPDEQYGAGIVNARNSLTQNFGPTRQLRARLYNALTGSTVQTVATAGGGSYSFPNVASGSYEVFAGQDENGDQEIGVPGRRWGAFGGAASPSTINVTGSGSHQASFTVGRASEQEPNETLGNANVLPVGGYLFGNMSPTDFDAYRVLIPQQGQYTFETSPVDGACGFALEEDTVIGLYDAQGTLLTSNDDIDMSAGNFCSRIATTLTPGTYHIGVQGYDGGSYRVQARAGP